MSNNSGNPRQKSRRGIGFQINVVIAVGVLLMVTILMAFVGYRSYDTMLASGTREKYNELGTMANPMQQCYTTAYQSAKALAARIDQIVARPPEQRSRADLVQALEATLVSNTNLVGTGVCFEPNAFDGNDAAFVHTEFSDDTGRAIPYAGKDPAGSIQVTPLTGYETDDWYLTPRTTHKTTLSEPYWYDATPTTKLYMLTISIPIMENGQFIGAITVDFDISPFQKGFEKVSSPDNYFILFSPKGTMLTHGIASQEISKETLKNSFVARLSSKILQ